MALSLSPTEIVRRGEYQLLAKAAHWERVRLGDIADVQNGFPFKSELFDREAGMPLIRIRDVNSTTTEHRYNAAYDPAFVVRRGEIIVGMDGDFKAARWQGGDALLNQRVCRLTLRSDAFAPGFFFLCLQPYLNAINAETSSVTVKHLSSRSVEDIPLPLPPIREQHRIVAKIEELFSELDKAVESLQLARAQLKTYRQALLKAAFEGKLTADWRAANPDKLEPPETLLSRIRAEREARYERALDDWQAALAEWRARGEVGRKPGKPGRPGWPTDADFSDLPKAPSGWTYAPFEALAFSIRNGISQKPDETGSLMIFRISAVRPMNFDMSDVRYLHETDEFEDFRLKAGDLVFTRYNGSRAFVGVAAVYRGDGSHVYPDKLIRCDIASERVDAGYLEKAVNVGQSRAFIEKRIRTTAGQAGISGADLKAMPVPVCGPKEQEEINRILDVQLSQIVHMDGEIVAALAKVDALRQSILKQAFSGQLVPQDPTDEPAAALHARLREQAPAPRTRRRKTA